MLFRKRKRSAGVHAAGASGGALPETGFYRIDYEMMLKGNTLERSGRPVRQCGVTVNGATHLVTSGDIVNRETFEALVRAGIVRPQQDNSAAASSAPENKSRP